MKRKGITAKLVKPSTRYVGLLMDEAQALEQRLQWAQQDMEQMELLREQYGIPDIPSKWYRLALEMAREMYPKPLKRGPKTKWNEYVCGILVVEVDRLVRSSGNSLNWAYETLGKRPRWRKFVTKQKDALGSKQHSIEEIYKAHKKKRGAKVAQKAFKMYEHEGNIEEWEKRVDEFLAEPLVGDASPD